MTSTINLPRTDVPQSRGRLTLCVAIPSSNRRPILEETLPELARQVRLPDEVVLCTPSRQDIPAQTLRSLPCRTRQLLSERGLCRQRNHILDHLDGADVVLFLDDDFLMGRTFLRELERIFLDEPDIVMCTGTVHADGATSAGLSVAEGRTIVAENESDWERRGQALHPVYSGYGCNMAFRVSAIARSGARFDERLPLYGWLEDVDFSRQVAHAGRSVRADGLNGVHLGTKTGRTSGVKLGYSQIANPVYLMRKRTMGARHAGIQMARNIVANTARVLRPEPWVDRRGRLRGNLRAMADLVRGKLSPEKIMAMD
ncbi:glycosyltransferase family 2 protein [Stappia indica]|uniref:glycosyltransferase family 2 protein n=1 Tax=Stappia indica TaxID=538381 RepID=UPI001CD41CDC|nr:glycosyltransferase family A protein [Stappia indica]MCA1298770.1 glycosyltransferase family 2 protein [Stappia indica]